MKFKEGDRVNHSHLGKGTFLEGTGFLSLVLWDKRPNRKYNMGENPCAVFTDGIEKQEMKDEERRENN